MRRTTQRWLHALPWIVLLCMLVGGVTLSYASNSHQPVYRAVYSLYAVPQSSDVSAMESASMLAANCNRLTKTAEFQSEVLSRARCDGMTYVDVRAVKGTNMMEVIVTGHDAQIAQELANAVGETLCEQLITAFQARSVLEIARAELPEKPIGLNASQMTLLVSGAAFVLASLLACCFGRYRETLHYDDPAADAFLLGRIGDTKRCLKRFRKDRSGGMLLDHAGRLMIESIRELLLVLRRQRTPECLVLCGLDEQDGSAVTAVLAASELAHQGFRVLLMEMDVETSLTAHYLRLKPRADLDDYLAGRAELDEVIQRTQIPQLAFVDWLHPDRQVAQIAATDLFSAFLHGAKEHFDIILMHAAGCQSGTDAAMLGRVADEIVLTAQDGRYTLDELEAQARRLACLGKPPRGVVFTGVDPRRLP